MPFINTKTTVNISKETEAELKTKLGIAVNGNTG